MATNIPNVKMHNFNTTLMGVVKGVADYHGLGHSDGWLYGGSGHAFLINIHDELCPSGPYCWHPETFVKLTGNLGISITDLGFFSGETSAEEKARVEELLRKNLDAGVPCSVLNMENQLITGYDDTQFILGTPWPMDLPVTPPTLTFRTWKEFGREVHVNFHTLAKAGKADDVAVIKESLAWAVDMVRNPETHTGKGYRVGLGAYDAWIEAVGKGHGASHGNWWNGTVWSECRGKASEYFLEIAQKCRGAIPDAAMELSGEYKRLSELILKASDKGLEDEEKIETLNEAKETEESAVEKIEELLPLL
jgi:hypothetical protein